MSSLFVQRFVDPFHFVLMLSITIDVTECSLAEFASLIFMIPFDVLDISQFAWIACQEGQEKRC